MKNSVKNTILVVLICAFIGICIYNAVTVTNYDKPIIKCEKKYNARCVLIAVPAKLVTAK